VISVSAVRAALITLLALTSASGCVALPLGTSGGIDNAEQQQLSHDIPLYDPSGLVSGSFINVGMITASGCDNALLGGPGRDEVVAQVRQQARAMGANGITDLSCEHADTSGLKGCISATACSATALKVFSPGAKTD
jgi:hypothetical protein